MAEKQNTPEIRFEGFTDPWEQRKLGELLLFQNGFNGSSESFGSGIPLISVMDVLDDEFITHETVRGKARLNYEEASRYCVEYGDVLFQRSSENQEDAGTSNVYLDQHVPSAFGGFVIRGKKVDEYNPIFIKYLLGSSFIREQITHRAQGAQHINVSQDTLAGVVLLMPSMREQEAVGLVFLHLANLITLHQRKHEKLCTVKKSMLDKMFPKPGETEPEIRFEGFTDPWEQRKLGEFSKKITTKNADGGLSETFTNSAEQGVISQLDYFDHDITNNANISGYYVVQPDNFVYNPRISVTAPCGPINRNRLNRAGVMSPLYTVFSVDESVDKAYLEHYFKTSRWHDFMFLEGNSGARSDRFSISDTTFFEMPIWCPKIPEQRAIAKQLETTDSLITLHQRKLELLRNIKKSLLDRMFV